MTWSKLILAGGVALMLSMLAGASTAAADDTQAVTKSAVYRVSSDEPGAAVQPVHRRGGFSIGIYSGSGWGGYGGYYGGYHQPYYGGYYGYPSYYYSYPNYGYYSYPGYWHYHYPNYGYYYY